MTASALNFGAALRENFSMAVAGLSPLCEVLGLKATKKRFDQPYDA